MNVPRFGLLEEAVAGLIQQRRFNDAQALLYEAHLFARGDTQVVLAAAMSQAIPAIPKPGGSA